MFVQPGAATEKTSRCARFCARSPNAPPSDKHRRVTPTWGLPACLFFCVQLTIASRTTLIRSERRLDGACQSSASMALVSSRLRGSTFDSNRLTT